MVCIAAFIVLIIVGIFVAFISIFKRDFGRRYLKVLKKSWHCFSKRVRFQKCDTSFQDDVKTAMLKKVALKKPQAVKPLSITIEVASIFIVLLTAWSLIEGVKAGLALWVFGTCNVSHPSSCALGAEVCSIDDESLNWFSEWGEIFSNIPDRLKNWDANDYLVMPIETISDVEPESTTSIALDIMDPGCSVCLSSYRNQLADEGFLEKHDVYIMLYAIKDDAGNYKFANSGLITNYYYALLLLYVDDSSDDSSYQGLSLKLIDRIYNERSDTGVSFQSVLNNASSADAEDLLKSWLKEWGLSETELATVVEKASSSAVQDHIEKIRTVVENDIKPKGIPTLLYDGRKHLGLYK